MPTSSSARGNKEGENQEIITNENASHRLAAKVEMGIPEDQVILEIKGEDTDNREIGRRDKLLAVGYTHGISLCVSFSFKIKSSQQ